MSDRLEDYLNDNFDDRYNGLSRADKGKLLCGKQDPKQSWDDFWWETWRDVGSDLFKHGIEYDEYQSEMRWLGRNYWRIG